MKLRLLIALIVLALVKVDTVMVPAETLYGDDSLISYDARRQVFVNKTHCLETWRFLTPDETERRRLLAPQEVPAKSKTVVSLRCDLLNDRRLRMIAPAALLGAAVASRKFVLINVEENLEGQDEQYRVWPHAGLLWVGTAARQEGWDVVLWDELIQGAVPLDKLVETDDVVGLSLVVTGIERGTRLAAQAKELGASHVVVGNDSAIFRANQLLRQPNAAIDAVFTSNSLDSVRQFFRELPTTPVSSMTIPGVAVRPTGADYRLVQVELQQEARARQSLKVQGKMNKDDVFVVPQFGLFPESYWQTVWDNYRRQFGHKHVNPETVRNAIGLLAQGCTRAGAGDICRYCTIYGVNDIRIPDARLLAQMVETYQRFGIDHLYNATDSAYEMAVLVRRLQDIRAKFNGLIIYGRGLGVAKHPELLDEWLSIVNDRLLINAGFDSGDEAMLRSGVVKATAEGQSLVELHRQAVSHVKASGAHLHYSMIFGSPGETRESCERTIEFVEWTCQELGAQLDVCETDVWWLNFGSPCSRLFWDYGYAQELAGIAGKSIGRDEWARGFARYGQALVVPMEVERAWYHYFTHISYEEAQSYNDRVSKRMAQHTGSIRGRAFKPTQS